VQFIEEYDMLFQDNIQLIRRLVEKHLNNVDLINLHTPPENIEEIINRKLDEIFNFNYNARCFIGVEIENSVSRKHLMGGAVNASVLSRIGLAVGFTPKMHNVFKNLYRYFQFLQSVDKPTFRTNNLLVISSTQLLDICS